ncbi:MAG: AAA family ATPase [Patescibacteria group bacterium]
MDEKLQKVADDFLARISQKPSGAKPAKPFVVATIGLPGSGRTTVAKMLVERLMGSILLSSNSVRYLLGEAGMSWGENIRQVLKYAGRRLLADGYGLIFDGNAADEQDRKNIEETTGPAGASARYVRINIDPEIAKSREKDKYDNPGWVSSFEDFRVNTTEKMLANIDERAELHRQLKSSDITGLAGEVDNNGSLDSLQKQVDEMAEKINRG